MSLNSGYPGVFQPEFCLEDGWFIDFDCLDAGNSIPAGSRVATAHNRFGMPQMIHRELLVPVFPLLKDSES